MDDGPDLDALVTAREAEEDEGLKNYGVTRHLIGMWKVNGKIAARGKRGRSPLYRFGDLLVVEAATRRSGSSWRKKQTRPAGRVTPKVSGRLSRHTRCPVARDAVALATDHGWGGRAVPASTEAADQPSTEESPPTTAACAASASTVTES